MPRKRHPAYLDSETQAWSRKQRHALPPKIGKSGLATRSIARAKAKETFAKQMAKEREIGVDPRHIHSSHRTFCDRNAWLKKSREYDLRA
jgi:hypothetical protein